MAGGVQATLVPADVLWTVARRRVASDEGRLNDDMKIRNDTTRWLNSLVVMALDLRLDGREFDSRPPWLILDG